MSLPQHMQNEKTDFPQPEKYSRGSRRAKSCCLLAATVILVLFALAVAAVVSILMLDTVSTRGEGYTFSQRMERYKVACQFIWFDLKGFFSEKKQDDAEVIECPAEPPPENDPSY